MASSFSIWLFKSILDHMFAHQVPEYEHTGPGVDGKKIKSFHTPHFQMPITFANGGQIPIADRILNPHIKGFQAIVLLGWSDVLLFGPISPPFGGKHPIFKCP